MTRDDRERCCACLPSVLDLGEVCVCVMRFHLISDLDLDESRVNIIASDVFFAFQENYLI